MSVACYQGEQHALRVDVEMHQMTVMALVPGEKKEVAG